MFKIQGFLSVNLLGQVVISRGQILVNSTGDNTLRVLCCALFVVCVVGVQCVGVLVLVLVLVLVCHADLHLHPLHTTPLTMCTCKTSPCVPAPRPQVLPLAGVVPVHTGTFWNTGFSACHTTPHRTHTPRPQKHTHKRQQPPQHTETGTERDRERRKRKCREDERLEKRRSRDKKREDEKREKTREEKMKDKRRWREKRREEERWKRRWKRSTDNEERQRWNEMKEKMIV